MSKSEYTHCSLTWEHLQNGMVVQWHLYTILSNLKHHMKNIQKSHWQDVSFAAKRKCLFSSEIRSERNTCFPKKKKKSALVPNILEILLRNSPSSHRGYPCGAAKFSAWVDDLPSKCQLCNICCSRHGRFYFHTCLLNWHSLTLLCQCCFSFPFCALFFHWNALSPHI